MLFLAAHNCELYSPLSQTDTTDWISGNQIEVYAQDSMVWDSTNNIWKFQHVNGQPWNNNMYAAKWQLKNARAAQRTIQTCCAEFLAYNVGDINSCYDVLPTRAGLGLYGTKNVITDSAQLFAPNGSGVIQYQYRNGTQVFTYTYGSPNSGRYIGYEPNTENHWKVSVFFFSPAQNFCIYNIIDRQSHKSVLNN